MAAPTTCTSKSTPVTAARLTHTQRSPPLADVGFKPDWYPHRQKSKGHILNQHRRRIDQVLDPEFVADIEAIDLDDLRQRRSTCDDLDSELSSYRRLLHARMDLLAFELRRRSGEETRTLIEALPDILSDGAEEGPSHFAVPKTLPVDPPDVPMEGRRPIDRVLGDDFLTHLPDIEDSELESIQLMLSDTERKVSEQRRSVYEVLEILTGEIARRYRDGIVSVSELLEK